MSSTGENPFRAPESIEPAVGTDQLSRHKIVAIARYQRGVMICILLYLLAVGGQLAIPFEHRFWLQLSILVIGIFAVVLVILLALQLYSLPIAVLFALGTLVPCLGLLVLLVINQKATNVLRKNGLRVGFLGASVPADMAVIEERL